MINQFGPFGAKRRGLNEEIFRGYAPHPTAMLLTQVFLVVPSGIAGTQRLWRAVYIHLPVFWIPAIPAGMTAISSALGL